jgi:hypothetical protein
MSLIELYNSIPPLICSTNNPDASIPKRYDETDQYFPISIVSRTLNRIDDTIQQINEFDTGISFTCKLGYYVEIHGTDELLKRGYSLPHPKLILPRNQGTIKLLLYKFSDKSDLELPFHSGLCAVLRSSNLSHIKKSKNTTPDTTTINYADRRPSSPVRFSRGALFE